MFENIFKLDRKYVIFKINRYKEIPFDIALMVFSILLIKPFNWDTRSNREEIQESNNRNKTLI